MTSNKPIKRGRPPVDDDDKRTSKIQICLTLNEYGRLRLAAVQAGMTPSVYARHATMVKVKSEVG